MLDVQERLGDFPLLLRRWYTTFRYVDFSQDVEQLHDQSCPVSGLGYNITLVFYELRECLRLREQLEARGVRVMRGVDRRQLLPFGAYASNCEPKGVWLPDDSIDPTIYDDGGGDVSFSEELRQAFDAAGFPFWQHMFRRRRLVSPLGFAPEYDRLRDSLQHNLVPV
jgi:hypothetical protein